MEKTMVRGLVRDNPDATSRLRLFANLLIDVPFSDERFGQMRFSLENENTLLVAIDASLFQTDWSGRLEYRFKTPLAQAFWKNSADALIDLSFS